MHVRHFNSLNIIAAVDFLLYKSTANNATGHNGTEIESDGAFLPNATSKHISSGAAPVTDAGAVRSAMVSVPTPARC